MVELQLIFCVEGKSSNKKNSASDRLYINNLLRYYFAIEDTIPIRYIELGGITNFNKPHVKNAIKKHTTEFEGITKIVYVIDSDDFTQKPVHSQRRKQVEEYCRNQGYECIIFVRDIEEVLIGKYNTSDKTKKAQKFVKNSDVKNLSIPKLSVANPMKNGTTNFLCVLKKSIPKELWSDVLKK